MCFLLYRYVDVHMIVDCGITHHIQTFLAQQYGYRALQSSIPEQDFTLLLAAVEETNSKKLIQTWYKLDTNAVPHEYILQSVSG